MRGYFEDLIAGFGGDLQVPAARELEVHRARAGAEIGASGKHPIPEAQSGDHG